MSHSESESDDDDGDESDCTSSNVPPRRERRTTDSFGIVRAKSTPFRRATARVSFAFTAGDLPTSADDNDGSRLGVEPNDVLLKSEPSSPVGSAEGESAAPVASQTFWSFVKADLFGSYSPAENVYRSRDNVVNFVHVPVFVERFILFGTAVCCDAFLFYFTLLPLRLLAALLSGRWLSSPSARVDATRAVLFAATVGVLLYVNPSILYHNIRGQNVIKLYVIFNVLEIVDKLLRSFGPDAIESLFWALTSRERGASKALTTWGHFLVALGYCVAHSVTHYLQIITLNVAVNSQNHMLTTLLISNQFVELKTVVYKKYDVRGVFFIVCCDMVERFQLIVSLAVVCLLNLHDLQFDVGAPAFETTLWAAAVCYFAEVLVDLIKHAFMSSYNELPVELYRRMDASLRRDLFDPQPSLFADASHTTTRRIGFAPLPLVCVTVRGLWRFLPELMSKFANHWSPWLAYSLLASLLLVAKLAFSFYLFTACSSSPIPSPPVKQRKVT
jgi:hypothetical protein